MKAKKIQNIITVSCQKSKIVLFTSSRLINIVLFPALSRFSVKIVCYLRFGSLCCLTVVYLNLLLSSNKIL